MSDYYSLARTGRLAESQLNQFLSASSIDKVDSKKGFTLLVEAVRNGQLYTVLLLLRKGASVDKKGRHGRTPLHYAIRAKSSRDEIVKALLDKGAHVNAEDDDGNTPLIVAVQETAGMPVVRLLVSCGASSTMKNKAGESAWDIANCKDRFADQNILRALSLRGYQAPERLSLITTTISFILFFFSYLNSGAVQGVPKGALSKSYNIGNTEVNEELAKEIKNPQTIEDFKHNINKFVEDNPELNTFFPSGNPFLQKVAEKAAQITANPDNCLTEAKLINDLTKLALYQTILYCDDSGSMMKTDAGNKDTRQQLLRKLISRMSSVVTRLVPDGEGVHLRFINKSGKYNSLNSQQIEEALDIEPKGGTNIGTQLRKKILHPFVFDPIALGETLKRPLLIIVVTDGHPTESDPDSFKKAIIDCSRALENNGYEPRAVRYLVSHIGQDAGAAKFIESLGGDSNKALDRIIHRTSDALDEKFYELHENEKHLEEWLLTVLMSPFVASTDEFGDS
ncbi:hypothetical protein TrVFT333_009223 [Trichoderma virens FT-333]|nr:hypothetical protein TrVFT333_009223 [Trichoderma virens FT-333]